MFLEAAFSITSKCLATPIFVFYYHDILPQHVNDATRVGSTRMARSVDGGCFEGVDMLKWQHINPYGTFALNMAERLSLEN